MSSNYNVVTIYENLSKLITTLNLKPNKLYHLYSDEGGMIGNPVFFISTKINDKIPYSTYHGKMDLRTIKNYIIGRLCTWYLAGNGDYTNKYKIILK